MSSGNAYQPIVVSDSGHKNFSFVATHFGCAGLDSSQELDCMRTVPSDDLQNFVGQYMDSFILVDPTLAPLRWKLQQRVTSAVAGCVSLIGLAACLWDAWRFSREQYAGGGRSF
jgi:hypothetical protein